MQAVGQYTARMHQRKYTAGEASAATAGAIVTRATSPRCDSECAPRAVASRSSETRSPAAPCGHDNLRRGRLLGYQCQSLQPRCGQRPPGQQGKDLRAQWGVDAMFLNGCQLIGRRRWRMGNQSIITPVNIRYHQTKADANGAVHYSEAVSSNSP